MATDAEGIATVDIQTCLQLLCTREVGRLAVSITDHPDIFPINYIVHHFDALDLPLFPWHAGPKHRFVRIEPIEITGRRFHVVGYDARGGDGPGAGRADQE